MAMVRKTLEEPHVLMAREAVERAKQHDRARLGLGIGPAAWMDKKYDDKGFIRKERKVPAAIRVQPAKGAGKAGRHSRALFFQPFVKQLSLRDFNGHRYSCHGAHWPCSGCYPW